MLEFTAFFDTLEPEFFKKASRPNLSAELNRVLKLTRAKEPEQDRFAFGQTSSRSSYFFRCDSRKREGIVTFSESRVILADRPLQKLEELFGFYVERNFVTPKYRETVLEDRMRSWFRGMELDTRLLQRQFDDGLYKASFPFVEQDDGAPLKIIKPSFFIRTDSNYRSRYKMENINLRRKAKLLPQRVLFAVEGPSGSGKHQRAYQESVDALAAEGVDHPV